MGLGGILVMPVDKTVWERCGTDDVAGSRERAGVTQLGKRGVEQIRPLSATPSLQLYLLAAAPCLQLCPLPAAPFLQLYLLPAAPFLQRATPRLSLQAPKVMGAGAAIVNSAALNTETHRGPRRPLAGKS